VTTKAIEKYLRDYAEPETVLAIDLLKQALPNTSYHHALCIPCYAENIEHLQRLLDFSATLTTQSQTDNVNVLFILVINQPDNALQEDSDKAINSAWLQLLKQKTEHIKTTYPYSAFLFQQHLFLTIDRFSQQAIPYKQGVGLARKIGADISLKAYTEKILQEAWLHTTDADSLLPNDYFIATEANKKNKPAAIIYPFKHIDKMERAVTLNSNDPITQATALYEKRLHQYIDGLKQANSAYAYTAIGSCICLSLSHYAMARGFPKQSAGEDFYLLNLATQTINRRSHFLPTTII